LPIGSAVNQLGSRREAAGLKHAENDAGTGVLYRADTLDGEIHVLTPVTIMTVIAAFCSYVYASLRASLTQDTAVRMSFERYPAMPT
jgi:ribosomal protein RSM22 (predicted rRNA methylase)